MSEQETIIYKLREYNRWRRGDEALPQPDPFEIGGYIDDICDIAERLECERDQLLEAAKAIVARWEMPSWKDTEPTAVVIYRLRDVVEAMSTSTSTVE